jgi:ribose/xylose/arabinose/galactoside ABC-type transport system permease subunit
MADVQNASEARSFLKGVSGFVNDNGSLIYLLLLSVVASAFVPQFFSIDNANIILRQSAVPAIACVGMALILVTGNIDLSMGYTVGLVSILLGIMIKNLHVPIFLSLLACLGIGLVVGAVNGLVVAFMKVPSFITTIGTGFMIYGLAQIAAGSNSINQLPASFLALGTKEVLGLPVMVYYALAIVLIAYFFIHRTVYGRRLVSIGSNEKASYLSGIRIRPHLVSIFIVSGVLSAFCGILLTMRVNCAQPDMGGGSFAFEAVTAAVVGGTYLLGGHITIIGCAFGALIVMLIENCINLLNINTYFYQSILGAVILCALIIEALKNKRRS